MKISPHVSPDLQLTLANLLRTGGVVNRDFHAERPVPCHAIGGGLAFTSIRLDPRRQP